MISYKNNFKYILNLLLTQQDNKLMKSIKVYLSQLCSELIYFYSKLISFSRSYEYIQDMK
jgi:hypothetical protein